MESNTDNQDMYDYSRVRVVTIKRNKIPLVDNSLYAVYFNGDKISSSMKNKMRTLTGIS